MRKSQLLKMLSQYPNSAEVFIHFDDDVFEISAIGYTEDHEILLSATEACSCCKAKMHKED